MKTKPKVWALIDDKVGSNSQTIGVAEKLGYGYEVKQIKYNFYANLPNFLLGASIKGIDIEKSSNITEDLPDIIIASGRRLAPISRYLKRQIKLKENRDAIIVQMMWPESGIEEFDIIVVPKHDNIVSDANVISTISPPHKITRAMLEKEHYKWIYKIVHLPRPLITVLVGGNSKQGKFTERHAKELGAQLSDIAKNLRGSLLVTTSRRTDHKAVATLQSSIIAPCFFHKWVDEKEENPYIAFLALADRIVVTGDSISMCAEAAITSNPIYIYAPNDLVHPKYRKFHEDLYEYNIAKPLTKDLKTLNYWRYNPLDVANDVVFAINTILSKKRVKEQIAEKKA